MDPVMLMKWLEVGQTVFPAMMKIIHHYGTLRDDPALSEVDREQMIANLEALKLQDWDQL